MTCSCHLGLTLFWTVIATVILLPVGGTLKQNNFIFSSSPNFNPERFLVWFDAAVSIIDRPDTDFDIEMKNEVNLMPLINQTYTRFRQIMVKVGVESDITATTVARFNKIFHNTSSMMRVWLVAKYGDPFHNESLLEQDELVYTHEVLPVLRRIANRANSIFPGTAPTILLDYSDLGTVPERLWAKELWNPSNSSSQDEVRIGVILSTQGCRRPISIPPAVGLLVFSNVEAGGNGFWFREVDSATEDISREFNKCAKMIIRTRENIELALLTAFTSKSTQTDFKNLVRFWGEMNRWAIETNQSVILKQAFDTPATPSKLVETPGWWRLVENSSYENTSQYKFQEKFTYNGTNTAEVTTILNRNDTKFDKGKILIAFDPYVAPRDRWSRKSFGQLDVPNKIKTIATKFRRIHLELIDSLEIVLPNLLKVPELIATFNKNESIKNFNNSHFAPLELTVGLSYPRFAEFQRTEQLLTKANIIFPNTMTTIIFNFHDDADQLNNILNYKSSKVGIRFSLHHCFRRTFQLDPILLGKLDKIILESRGLPKAELMLVDQVFSWETTMFERCKRKLLQNNLTNTPEIILETSWPDVSKAGEKNIFALVNFWDRMNAWSVTTNNSILFCAAFDESVKYDSDCQHCGWWSLTNNLNDLSSEYIFQEKKLMALELLLIKDQVAPVDSQLFGILHVALIVVITGLVFLLAVISVRSWRRYNRDPELLEIVKDFNDGNPDSSSNWLSEPYFKGKMELKVDQFEVFEEDVLGSGAFGKVCRGKVKKSMEVDAAVKMKNSGNTTKGLRSLLSDIKILSYLGPHENIIGFLGAHTAELKRGRVYVFLEFCSGGSLDKSLKRWRKELLESRSENGDRDSCGMPSSKATRLCRWVAEILSGMSFLAEKKVVHADLATRNILLTADNRVKISDFGLSRRLYDFGLYVKKQNEALPWRWMAPESLRRLEFTEKTDVWSFGVTLWEIFTLGELPYPGITCPWQANLAGRLERGFCLEQPVFADESLYEVQLQCLRADSANRPTFGILKDILWPPILSAHLAPSY